MDIFDCPCCQNPSVVWDARAKAFLCRNPECRESFPPLPPKTPSQPTDMILLLSWNMVPSEDIRDWLEHSHHPNREIRVPTF